MAISAGDLVHLTKAYEAYLKSKHPFMSVQLENRIAKIEEIIDWGSEKGQKIKAARIKTQKWGKLPLEDNKYILSVYYPELQGRSGQRGVIDRGVPSFSKDPKSGAAFFSKISEISEDFLSELPGWMSKDIKARCKELKIEWKK